MNAQGIAFMGEEKDGSPLHILDTLFNNGYKHVDSHEEDRKICFYGSIEGFESLIFVYMNPNNKEVWGIEVVIPPKTHEYLNHNCQYFKQLYKKKHKDYYIKKEITNNQEQITIADYENKTHLLNLRRDISNSDYVLRILFLNQFNVNRMTQ